MAREKNMRTERNSTLPRLLLLTVPALAGGPLRAAFVTHPSFEDNYTTNGNGSITPIAPAKARFYRLQQ